MNTSEAANLIREVCAQINTSLVNHNRIQDAIKILENAAVKRGKPNGSEAQQKEQTGRAN